MLFNSARFLLFFPIVCLMYYIFPKRKIKNLFLLLASYLFYMCWDVSYGFLLLAMTGASFFFARCIDKVNKAGKKPAVVFCVSLLMTLGVLFVFKYFNFAVDTINSIVGSSRAVNARFSLVLPVGISFYTFQISSYLIDVYKGTIEAERSFVDYALYVSFFPQLVAGPIERSCTFLKQFKENHKFDYKLMCTGLVTMLWGYFLKMVIADRAAMCVDIVYGNIQEYTGFMWVIATVLFSVQVYCDFAGYSTIAVGAGMVLGFRMTDNFQAPFISRTISEFWRRWHISLYDWFKNYVYIPLGGSRKGLLRKYINVLVVTTVSGLWHGANWTFVIWGLLNGMYQIVGSCLKNIRSKLTDKISNANKFAGICVHIVQSLFVSMLFDFSLIFFRAQSLSEAWSIIASLFTKYTLGESRGTFAVPGFTGKTFIVFLIALVLLLIVDIFKYNNVNVWIELQKKNICVRYSIYIFLIVFVLLFGAYGDTASEFIYFVF